MVTDDGDLKPEMNCTGALAASALETTLAASQHLTQDKAPDLQLLRTLQLGDVALE